MVRHRANCLEPEFEMWIDGFPRTGNSFCVEMFRDANPNVRLRSHRHLPPFIIQAVEYGIPGILLIRKPVDAASSWAIYRDCDVGQCLDYYNDFHHALRRYIPRLFIATFEQVTQDLPDVIDQFNRRVGTRYALPQFDDEKVQECFARIDRSQSGAAQPVSERHASRPSAARELLKPEILAQIQTQSVLKTKLDRANALYLEFRSAKRRRRDLSKASTAHLPTVA
jgi:hypothetical protein